MTAKAKSILSFVIIFVSIAGIALLALNGLQIGKYRMIPVGQGISLGLDLRGGVYAVYQAKDTSVENFESRMDGTIGVLRNRLDGQGFTEATLSRQGNDRIRIEIPDVKDPNEIVKIIGTPAKLEFTDPDGNVLLTGEMIKSAEPQLQTSGAAVVAFELTDEGAKLFADATAKFMGQIISINLDGSPISQPRVNSVISGGQGVIEGMESLETAKNLAMLIQSGALPLDITEIEVRAISATLGVEALDRSLLAGAIGLCLIFLFMIGFYRLPGLMAGIALSIYVLIVIYALALIPGVQLTLTGIAGIVLAIGMAVDANVIIFERIREELKLEKTLRSSCEVGFKNALSAIVDSNITTIIAAAVLLAFGTGSIKGFAITLIIGVVVSLFTAVFVTRFLLRCLLGLGIQNRKLYTR